LGAKSSPIGSGLSAGYRDWSPKLPKLSPKLSGRGGMGAVYEAFKARIKREKEAGLN
jgi:hypothetical protein